MTDVDDNNASVANVGPGGITSGDEYSIDGSKKGGRIKARFQVSQDYANNMDQVTQPSIDPLDLPSKPTKKGGAFGSYQFNRTATAGFNTGSANSIPTSMARTDQPSVATGAGGSNSLMNLQMQQIQQMGEMTKILQSGRGMNPD